MASILQTLGFKNTQATTDMGLPEIFQFLVSEHDFIKTDVENIYSRILTDVVERCHGISDKVEPLLWDSCLSSDVPDGVVSLLAKAMVQKSDLFLVYDTATNVARTADPTEQNTIKEDYEKQGESKVGVYVSFNNFTTTDMIRIYSALEYCTIASLHKNMSVAKALQLKMSELRSSVSLEDNSQAITQAKAIADSLSKGKDVLLDAKDSIDTTTPDVTATNSSMEFIAQKQSFYLGLPSSYIMGLTSTGLSDTGAGDAKAIDRGLKKYFYSIIKPVLEKLFSLKLEFKSEDNHSLQTALEVAKTFSLVDEEFISVENKTKIINKVFGLDEDATGDGPEETPPTLNPLNGTV